jgi:hypothetical protein
MVWIEKKVVLKSMIKNERKVKKEFKFWWINDVKIIWLMAGLKKFSDEGEGLRIDSSGQFANGLVLKSRGWDFNCEKGMLKRVKKEWFCFEYSMKMIEKLRDDRRGLMRDREGGGKGRKKIWVGSRCI